MSEKELIKSLVKEAKVYHAQGLLEQSKDKFREVLKTIEGSERYRENRNLKDAVEKALQNVEIDMEEVESMDPHPELSLNDQNLIKRLFSVSDREEIAVYKGAVALARFGQYESALLEFQRLLRDGIFPLVAAKNIITCHMAYATADVAIAQFDQWASRRLLSRLDLQSIRRYLEDLLLMEGIPLMIPWLEQCQVEPVETKKEKKKIVPPFSLAIIRLEEGPQKGEIEEFEVIFQSDTFISIMISKDRKNLLSAFRPGVRITNLDLYSQRALLRGSGIVFGKTRVTSGPREGNYIIDFAVEGL